MVQNAKSATKWFSTHHALASNQGGNVFHGTTTPTKSTTIIVLDTANDTHFKSQYQYGTDVACEEHQTLFGSKSRQKVYDCAAATSVMSTNALALLLLNQFRSGALEIDIAKELDALRSVLKGRRDPLVPGLIELTYYSNTLTPSFAFELIVLTSLHTLFSDKPNDAGISRKHLLKAGLENCGVYRYEFILNKFTQVLDQLLESTINELLNREFIKGIDTKEMTESDVMSKRPK
ncbi:uncharacterized protein LOC129914764 [Episyrphus balteatus]|uniref:uncharacterized protein LOC129914764 n=1 Tax=Episyrphus balteatus TaxID=286459 RepID=UPI002485427D|nr:uncharacterized protein LOC129914764 [Episyrphus balteatus]